MSFPCRVEFVTILFDIGQGMGLQFSFFEQKGCRTGGIFPEGFQYHRDKEVFGKVIGISLLAPCVISIGSDSFNYIRFKTQNP
jgi:hypothetical protein